MLTRPLLYVLLLFAFFVVGCKSESDTADATKTDSTGDTTQTDILDFDVLLAKVDNAIGKRFQAMQMEGMNSVSYQYDGPIETVVDIVEPIAKASGFSEAKNEHEMGMGEAEKEMQAKMGIDMSAIEQKMYTHPNGDTLVIVRMDMSNEDIDMKILAINMMNSKKMSDFGQQAMEP